jgi:hypothetical protein
VSPGFAYSLFYVGKPQSTTSGTRTHFSCGGGDGTTTAESKIQILTRVSSGLARMGINITNNGNRLYPLTEEWHFGVDIDNFNNLPFRVLSYRAKDVNNLVDTALYLYNNLITVSTSPMINLASETTNTGNTPHLFGRSDNNSNLSIGRLGEFIIINKELTENEHLSVVQFIMNRWGII